MKLKFHLMPLEIAFHLIIAPLKAIFISPIVQSENAQNTVLVTLLRNATNADLYQPREIIFCTNSNQHTLTWSTSRWSKRSLPTCLCHPHREWLSVSIFILNCLKALNQGRTDSRAPSCIVMRFFFGKRAKLSKGNNGICRILQSSSSVVFISVQVN